MFQYNAEQVRQRMRERFAATIEGMTGLKANELVTTWELAYLLGRADGVQECSEEVRAAWKEAGRGSR